MSCQLSTINYQIMIKHIFKIIWAQRKSNGWILGELVIVMCALWFMMDKLWVDVRCYNAPMGYDISKIRGVSSFPRSRRTPRVMCPTHFTTRTRHRIC